MKVLIQEFHTNFNLILTSSTISGVLWSSFSNSQRYPVGNYRAIWIGKEPEVEYGKYIIVQNERGKYPIIFPGILSHGEVVGKFGRDEQVVSGGMFYCSGAPTQDDPQNISITVFRGPDSLAFESHREDGRLIKELFRKSE